MNTMNNDNNCNGEDTVVRGIYHIRNEQTNDTNK